MGDGSAIQWTNSSWNVTTGCDRISSGCDNCYALVLSKRLKAMGAEKYQNDGDPRTSGPGFGVTFHEGSLLDPLRWRRPRKVFVNSMSDLAHAHITDRQIARVFAVMALGGQHSFQLLTKRPRRLRRLLQLPEFWAEVAGVVDELRLVGQARANLVLDGFELPNVWIGTSIESNEYVWRAAELRHTPASVRFLSLEPLIGPVADLDLSGIDWVIVGGESGQGHRPLDLGWVRDIRDQCQDKGIPFFFKQVGGRTPKAGGRTLDGRTWDGYPAGVLGTDGC